MTRHRAAWQSTFHNAEEHRYVHVLRNAAENHIFLRFHLGGLAFTYVTLLTDHRTTGQRTSCSEVSSSRVHLRPIREDGGNDAVESHLHLCTAGSGHQRPRRRLGDDAVTSPCPKLPDWGVQLPKPVGNVLKNAIFCAKFYFCSLTTVDVVWLVASWECDDG